MAKSKYKVAVMDELPTEEQLAMEKMEQASLRRQQKVESAASESKPESDLQDQMSGTQETQESVDTAEVEATPAKAEKVAGFRSNRYKQAKAHIDRTKTYSVSEAVKLLKTSATAKFDETVEVHFVSKESLGNVEVAYPHSIGKTVKVAVFSEDILEELNKGITNFDVLVASPADMKNLTKFARVLGPKGLMPNPKNGTLVADPAKRAKELSSGKTSVRGEKKAPLLHTTIGKISMDGSALEENFTALLNACGQGKVLKAVICTSMSPGIKVQIA